MIFFFYFLFLFLWLCWVFVSVRGLSPVVASGGHPSSRCAGLSRLRPLLLRSTGSRRAGSAIVAHGPSCSAARGIPPDQGSNPCPLHWQADSQPLRHQGSPEFPLFMWMISNTFSPAALSQVSALVSYAQRPSKPELAMACISRHSWRASTFRAHLSLWI